MQLERVLLGMSGGVDSTAACRILQERGYEVVGLTLLTCEKSLSACEEAAELAARFGIEHHIADIREEFQANVIAPFLQSYLAGITPNPCIDCNPTIKFRILMEEADRLGCKYIATGHYVRTVRNGENVFIKQGADNKKDQSYFLAMVNPDIVQKCIFPLGGLTKEEVRDIAREIGLPVAEKKDSQEICFIPDNDYKTCLNKVLPPSAFRKGKVFHADGSYLGEHTGIQNYTIGQRKGLGISLGKPAYVVALDAKRNRVILGDNEHLMADTLTASDNNYFIDVPIDEPFAVEAKIRYRAQTAPATLLRHADGTSTVTFAEPQRAITPGQYVAYYINDLLIGGGIINN